MSSNGLQTARGASSLVDLGGKIAEVYGVAAPIPPHRHRDLTPISSSE